MWHSILYINNVSHCVQNYKYMIMLFTTMLKSLNVSKINPDDYNSIISDTYFGSCKHSFNPFYSTAFKFPKLIFEPVTIMPVTIAHNSVLCGSAKNFSVIQKDLIYCYYVVMVTMLLNGHTVNSSVTCYTS